MLIRGEWAVGHDGVARPVVRGEVQASDGSWQQVAFLLDTGADRTVLNAPSFALLHVRPITTGYRLGGLGGEIESVPVETVIRLHQDSGGTVVFRGQYFGVSSPEALDMSVLGRDISGLFAVIVDRPSSAVYLLSQRHHYTIVPI